MLSTVYGQRRERTANTGVQDHAAPPRARTIHFFNHCISDTKIVIIPSTTHSCGRCCSRRLSSTAIFYPPKSLERDNSILRQPTHLRHACQARFFSLSGFSALVAYRHTYHSGRGYKVLLKVLSEPKRSLYYRPEWHTDFLEWLYNTYRTSCSCICSSSHWSPAMAGVLRLHV